MAEEKGVDIEARIAEVDSCISSGAYLNALNELCSNIPSTKDDSLKEKLANLAKEALIGASDIESCLDDYNEEQLTNLMKYVCRSMAIDKVDGKACNKLLAYHKQLVEKCGVGIICRAMMDRRL